MGIVERLRTVGKDRFVEIGDCLEVMADAADEIELLRQALSTIHGGQYRVVIPEHPNWIIVGAEKWYNAFTPLIAPPYNQLRWEKV